MAQKQQKKTPAEKDKSAGKGKNIKAGKQSGDRLSPRETAGIVCIVLALFSVLVAFTKTAALPKLYFQLICGLVGQSGFYASPVALLLCGALLLWQKKRPVVWRIICAAMVVMLLSALTHLFLTENQNLTFRTMGALWSNGISGSGGGLLGGFVATLLYWSFGAGAYPLVMILLIVCLMTAMNYSLPSIFRAIRNRPREEEPEESGQTPAERLVDRVAKRRQARAERRRAEQEEHQDEQAKPVRRKRPMAKATAELVQEELDLLNAPKQSVPQETVFEPAEPAEPMPLPAEVLPDMPEKVRHEEAVQSAVEIAKQVSEGADRTVEYQFPPLSLLERNSSGMVDGTAEMQENSKRLADTLRSFGVEPHIVNVTRGPSVTRYELELERGVKLSKITGLADDIALSLGTSGVRISAIPDRISVVGIEVPNKLVSTVYASEVIDSAAFRKSKSAVSFAVGKDIGGNCIVGDISKLPHMLIAGTTGSGKSVCMNTLIISLLYKTRPEDVRFIMIDPKMVEFSVYDGIPHLLVPVVKDAKKAAGALQWTVTEMMRRYRMMSDRNVRDLESYNKVAAAEEEPPLEKIVVLIDELADLMMVAAKEVEDSVCRIAQMGRAAGIHLIIATQRPSANVITGLMKANIPSRIAFAVASAMESRIILDTSGAEKLVGRGDMLYAPLGQGKPKRVQGCFISDEEVSEVVTFIKENSQPSYSAEILEQMEKQTDKSSRDEPETESPADEGDELLPAAVEVLLDIGQASTSMLQRRLKLGYARAARIMDQLEERGIVGPFEGSRPRQLLITKEQWMQMQNGQPEPPVEDELP